MFTFITPEVKQLLLTPADIELTSVEGDVYAVAGYMHKRSYIYYKDLYLVINHEMNLVTQIKRLPKQKYIYVYHAHTNFK